MSKHTITAWAPFGLDPDGLPVDVTFTYSKGSPDYWNKTAGLWEQGYAGTVDFISVHCEDLKLPPEYQKKLDEWAVEYLATEEGFGSAVDFADYKSGYAL